MFSQGIALGLGTAQTTAAPQRDGVDARGVAAAVKRLRSSMFLFGRPNGAGATPAQGIALGLVAAQTTAAPQRDGVAMRLDARGVAAAVKRLRSSMFLFGRPNGAGATPAQGIALGVVAIKTAAEPQRGDPATRYITGLVANFGRAFGSNVATTTATAGALRIVAVVRVVRKVRKRGELSTPNVASRHHCAM